LIMKIGPLPDALDPGLRRATGFAVCVIGAGRGGCRSSIVPRGRLPRSRIPVIRRLTVFAAVGAREGWAVTGRFREKFLSRLTGPARQCEVAYILSHRV